MSDHRRTVSRKAFVLPGWVLVGVGLVAAAAAGWLVWIGVAAATGDDDPSAAPTAAATSASPEPSPEPSESEPTPTPTQTTEPEPEPTEPEPTESSEPAVDRSSIAVSVLNASRTSGLAATVGQRVQAAGWSVGAVGNWRGYVPQNSVYYPAGFEQQARQLAADLGIASVAPLQNGMTSSRLTVLVIGPVG